jgi:hypothetical protein
MMEGKEWSNLTVREDVALLLGWRDPNGNLNAGRVRTAKEVRNELRKAAKAQLHTIESWTARELSGTPALEAEDEFLAVATSTPVPASDSGTPVLHAPPSGTTDGMPSSSREQVTELVEIVQRGTRSPTPTLSRSDLEKRNTWLFYVVLLYDQQSRPIGFVRQVNPQRGMSAGRLRTSLQAATLHRLDDPLFIFDGSFNLIVGPDEIAILSTTAFERLFSDLEIARQQAPENLQKILADLVVPLQPKSQQQLATICVQKRSLARRLGRIADCEHLKKIDRKALTSALKRHGLPANRFGNGAEVELNDNESVVVFLDMLEELYFETDFSGEFRRADRYSKRRAAVLVQATP